VLVEGQLETRAAEGTTVEIRVQRAKTGNASEPDVWSHWERIGTGKPVHLGRARFNGRNVSIHGAYRFQIRVSVAPNSGGGLQRIALTALFENAIMSLPRLLPGRNDLRFELREASMLRAPVVVSYKYQTAAGERVHRQTLSASDFKAGAAGWVVNAPDLLKCNSVSVSYR